MSVAHKNRLGEKENAETQARLVKAREDARRPAVLSFGASRLNPELPPPKKAPEPQTVTQEESEMWMQVDSGEYKIEIDDPEADRKRKLKEFERRVQEFDLMAGLEQLPSEVDADLNIFNTDREDDDTLANILETISQS